MLSLALKAVIFDMDGVLIDSEPVWQQSELDVFSSLGLPISYQDTLQTTGLRVDQLVEYWYQRYPWENYDNAETATQIVNGVIEFIQTDAKPMRGVIEALQICQQQGYRIGLATSSSMSLVDAVLDKFEIRHFFQAIESAEHLKYGKPHPEVYLNCATRLGVAPSECIAIEDSMNGLIAARAANMLAIAIPPHEQQHDVKWMLAHYRLHDLTEFSTILN
ncbi:hexitol phosphatase HxpB [Shewanella sp. 202IG2-18]|uniref:hexitol phosphatase HxpB n=1 Tax=Parashewanella hymeniacidonis TaxID=2807618 RepID=UPI00195FF482|nr:hexitol phosphatase HxpB [Parashewanella hymeniacidonis]MBM7072242.1 hexitol phosphatase HxpB [Parashewanella hymeniacidonis]